MVGKILPLVIIGLILSVLAQPQPVFGSGSADIKAPFDHQGSSPWPMWGGSLTHNRTSKVHLVEGREFYKAWEVQVTSWRGGSCVVSSNGTAYVSNDEGDLLAVGSDGMVLWTFDGPGDSQDSCPFIGPDGTIYYSSTCDNLFAVNPNGTLKWNISLDSGIGPSATPPIVSEDGTVFLGVGGHRLYAVDADGRLNWTLRVSGCIYNSPVMDRQGRILFNTAHGTVYCVSTNGTVIWEHYLGAYAHSTTSVTNDGEVVVCDDDGRVHCLYPNGSQKWMREGMGELMDGFAVSDDGCIYGTFKGGHYIGSFPYRLVRLLPDGFISMIYNLSGTWGPPVIMDKGQVIMPGPGIYVFGSRRDTVWSEGVTLRCVVPVNEYEFRALTDNGILLAIRSYKVPPVRNISAEQVVEGIVLRWFPPEGMSGSLVNYTVSRAVQGGTGAVEIGMTDDTEFLDVDLPTVQNLIYYITAEVGGEHSRPSSGYHIELKKRVESLELHASYLYDKGIVMVLFEEERDPRYEYLDEPIDHVQILRSLNGVEFDPYDMVYPSTYVPNDLGEGSIGYVVDGEGVYYDRRVEPGSYHHYIVEVCYGNGETVKGETNSVYVPEVEIPTTPVNFLRDHWTVVILVLVFDAIAVCALLFFVLSKWKGLSSRDEK